MPPNQKPPNISKANSIPINPWSNKSIPSKPLFQFENFTNQEPKTATPNPYHHEHKKAIEIPTIIFSNKVSEDLWFDCKNKGAYAIWTRPMLTRTNLVKWFEASLDE